MSLQARTILRNAKKFGIQLQPDETEKCALAVVARTVGLTYEYLGHHYDIVEATGHSFGDISALEYGFEGAPAWLKHRSYLKGNRYFKVGQNLRKKIGLPAQSVD